MYVHSLIKGFHPNNVYRVVSATQVRSGPSFYYLAETERVECPGSGSPCACAVVQKEERS